MKDRLGNEMFRRQDAQGRPLKLISQPPTDAYRKGWEETFGKPQRKRAQEARGAEKRLMVKAKEVLGG